MTSTPSSIRMATSAARNHLSDIITRVQDPRSYCVLTKHGKAVAAIVSMAELHRIWEQQDIEDVVVNRQRPAKFRFGTGGHMTNHEAAEAIQKVQMDRRMEREVLHAAGLEPIPGGELTVEGEDVADALVEQLGLRDRVWSSVLKMVRG